MTIKQWRDHATKELSHLSSPDLDARLILEHILEKDSSFITAHSEEEIDDNLLHQLDDFLQRRKNHEPIAYLTGSKEFYGNDFFVNSDVLIPRAETENLVEYLTINAPKYSSLLDVGTGSGAIAISLKLERPDINVLASDVSHDAIKVAQINANKLKADINFVQSDLLENIEDKFDVIAANLPYVPEKLNNPEISYEPKLALFSQDEGLKLYKKFFDQAKSKIKRDGFIIVEHDPEQLDKLCNYTSLKCNKITEFVTKFTN